MNEANYTKWVEYAESDLKSAQFLYEQNGSPGHVIFHCHDSIEKFLKAIMLKNSLDFHYIHKLRSLADGTPISKEDKLYLDNTFITLDALYLYCRYPEMEQPPGKKEAKSALKRTLETVKILKKYL